LKITSQVRFVIHILVNTCYNHEVGLWQLERFQTAKVTFKVTQGHWYIVPFDKPHKISY